MKRTSAKELLNKHLENKICVVVYPNTDWMKYEYNGHLIRKRLDLMEKKLGVDSGKIVDNDYFIFEFGTEKEAREFFDSFGEEYEEPYYVELYIDGTIMGENT